MAVTTSTRTVAEIVDGLKDHVWTLICAQQVEAAMVLLASELEAYLAAEAAGSVLSVPESPVLEGTVVATGTEVAALPGRGLMLLVR